MTGRVFRYRRLGWIGAVGALSALTALVACGSSGTKSAAPGGTSRPASDRALAELTPPPGVAPAPPPASGSGTGVAAAPSGGSLALTPSELEIARATNEAPVIYLGFQADGSNPVSLIFAIDAARDGTPNNDPAIRLTPEGGDCNPQVMQSFDFPPEDRAKPVFSTEQILKGIKAEQLPNFLALTTSFRMLERGIAKTRQETRPHNICARKLWELQVQTPAAQG